MRTNPMWRKEQWRVEGDATNLNLRPKKNDFEEVGVRRSRSVLF